MPRKKLSPGGFTLMEILTVISIITLLISITLPSLAGSKEVARKAKCASNLHQQGLALSSYLTNGGTYPGHAASSAQGQIIAVWPTRLRMYMTDQAGFDCPSAPAGFAWQRMMGSPGGLFAVDADRTWGYKLGERLLVTSGASSIPFSYGYNDWGTKNPGSPQRGLGGDINFGFPVGHLKDDQVAQPSNMIGIGDNTNDGNWDFNLDPREPPQYPGKLHLQGCNMLFADTHVEWELQSTWINVGVGTAEGRKIAAKWNNHNRPE
ncbi:MAG: prepilin-type N-terminal cleavage/methylation domain-containing protein [Pyrinomonadaceae bacterium]|nr:prepilin-type N-terminal cleavage/methylation domain-containing protein [Phycisphaerales bacterium]